MDPHEIDLEFCVNSRLGRDYLTVIFLPHVVDMSIVSNGEQLAQLLSKNQQISSMHFLFTLLPLAQC
jgi:hypothetical protein